MHSPEAPVAWGTLLEADFNIVVLNANFVANVVEEQPDQLLLSFYRTAFHHRYFNDRICIRTVGGVKHVFHVHEEETVRPLVGWKLQGFHHALMDNLRQTLTYRNKLFLDAVNFYLSHYFVFKLVLGACAEYRNVAFARQRAAQGSVIKNLMTLGSLLLPHLRHSRFRITVWRILTQRRAPKQTLLKLTADIIHPDLIFSS